VFSRAGHSLMPRVFVCLKGVNVGPGRSILNVFAHMQAEDVSCFSDYRAASGASSNSGAGSGKGQGRLFCWQAYLKEEKASADIKSQTIDELFK
jgi:hypothetical protein